MTTSLWNDEEIGKQFAECTTLRDIITHIESEFSQRGEVICEIRVNGMTLSEADEAKFAESPRTEIKDLAVLSNRPEDLVRGALNSIIEIVPQLEASSLKTAEAFRGADGNYAQACFGEALEGCQWLVDTLTHVRGAASGIGQPILRPERWLQAEQLISKAINDLSQAYASSDHVLVADLLEYELTGALNVWLETVSEERTQRS